MTIKSILVHIADDEDHLPRFKAAVGLARAFNAHLTALYVTSPVHFKGGLTGRGASINFERERIEFAEKKVLEIEAEFREYLFDSSIDLEWVTVDGGHLDQLTYYSAFNDLAIVSQTEAVNLEEVLAHNLPDQLALTAACPVLVLPHQWEEGSLPDTVVLGWKPSAPANHALRGAMPFLQHARNVKVVTISPKGKDDPHDQSVILHLKRHGVEAELVHRTGSDAKAGHELIEQAEACGAGLVVMGGFSHSRLHDLVIGSATSQVLNNGKIPLLMAH